MKLDEWIKYFEGDMDAVNTAHYLQKSDQQHPFTDEEIIEAINLIEEVAIQCGLTRTKVLREISGNIMDIKMNLN